MRIYDDEQLLNIVEGLFGTGCNITTNLLSFKNTEIHLEHIIEAPLAPVALRVESFTSNNSLDNYYMIGDDFIDTLDEFKERLDSQYTKAFTIF